MKINFNLFTLFHRDRYIEHLLHQLEQLSAELNKIRSDYNQEIGGLREEIFNLESRLAEKESEIEEALKQKEDIERKLSEAAQSAQIGSVVQLQLDVRWTLFKFMLDFDEFLFIAGNGKTSQRMGRQIFKIEGCVSKTSR